MSTRFSKYRFFVVTTLCMMLQGQFLFSQTPANTTIRNQAKGAFQYKSFPGDTVISEPMEFIILAAPNFEISFGVRDTNVFGKETLLVRLVYKNVGNLKADTATIEGILPPAGLKFVPGSTLGIINNNGTVTWKKYDVQPGQVDSVGVKMVVDSALVAGTQLSVDASISWLASSALASQVFVVNSFPRLVVTNTPLTPVVGSGRTISYQIIIKNTGNLQSTNTTLVDTISALGQYQSSNVTPDSIKSVQRLIIWKLGNIPAFSEKSIAVIIVTQPNLPQKILSNSAFAYSSNVSNGSSAKVDVSILPIAPKTITISADPVYIFGKLNKDSSLIQVSLRDSTGDVLPDGVPVQFTSQAGSFSNNQKSISKTLQDGVASTMFRSEDVSNKIKQVFIDAIGGSTASGTIEDSTDVRMYPGAVRGVVVNGLDHKPLQGAIARVFNSANSIVGADTTENDGKFFIALDKDTKLYTLEILVLDKYGDSVSTRATIDPRIFPIPPIVIPNTISGRLVYKQSDSPIPIEGVTIYLDSLSSSGKVNKSLQRTKSIPGIPGIYSRVHEQQTDRLGRFKFENLMPARYVVTVDSTQFPSYKGYNFIADTVAGTFTINFSIEINQDSTVQLSMHRENSLLPIANAGDTLDYKISTSNIGNLTHYNVALTDTLSRFLKFVSAKQGKFNTAEYDTANHIVTWHLDSLRNSESDSLQLKVLLSRNIPDSTNIRNTVWFSSNLLTHLNSVTNTTVRSFASLQFGNLFVGKDSTVAGDSVQKMIWFSNTGTDSLKGIKIIDSIHYAGMSRLKFVDSTSTLDSIIVIDIGAIAPGASDTVTLTMLTDFSLTIGTKITSSAHIMRNDSSLLNVITSLTMIDNPNISTFLKITKTANKKVAEIGDIVTYQIQISNSSPTYLHSVGVYDLLPYAFKYIKNSARFNGKQLEPSLNPALNLLTWNSTDTMLSGKTGNLVYQLAIGADGLESDGMNTARASATASVGTILTSAASQWQITVRPGVFTEKGLIIGKVFYDDNRNTFQETGENGIKDVEIWMEDGTKIVTGDDGKYSLPEVKPGQHVLRINESSLPTGTELLLGNNKFAKDASSQFVRLTESGIAKANFFIKRNVKDSIKHTLGKVNKLLAARQVKPKFIYSDTIANVSIDTVDMYVTFTFSCGRYLQTIEVNETLPQEFSIVPNSGSYNGRKINPSILGNGVQWKIGRSTEYTQGVLKYKVAVKSMPKNNSVLLTMSTVRGITSDSVVIESQKLLSENIIRDVRKNRIETSDVSVKSAQPNLMTDSVTLGAGDEVFFKTMLYIDPKMNFKSVRLIDSLESEFIVNDRSFAVNGVPLPSRNLSVRVRSSSLTARTMMEKSEIEFLRIASVNLTELIRQGLNEVTYSAKLNIVSQDTVYKKTTYASVINEFNEESLLPSQEVRLKIRSSIKPSVIVIETSYVDIYRPIISLESKVSEAVRLIESLKKSNTSSVVMEGITFEPGKTVLTAEAKVVLDNIAKILKENPELKIQVNGHSDNTGNANVNRKVSLARAQEVRNYLLKQGIEVPRLFAQGFGPDKPIATNKTEEGRAKNRRVEFMKRK